MRWPSLPSVTAQPPHSLIPPPPQTKDLELSNPSKKAISYSVRLEGHKDFSTQASVVRIDAKGNARLQMRCMPTTTVPVQSRWDNMASLFPIPSFHRLSGFPHIYPHFLLLLTSTDGTAPLQTGPHVTT